MAHTHCTFYVYSATSEWSFFSGNAQHVPQYKETFQRDAQTGYASVIFTARALGEEKVYAFIETDVSSFPDEYVTLYVQQLYYEQQIQAQQQQSLAVVQLVGELNSSLQLKSLLQKIMDYTLAAIPAIDRGFLMLVDQQEQKLYTVAKNGMNDAIYNYEPAVGEGIAGYTFLHGKSRIYNYKEAIKVMWNVTQKNRDAMTEAFKPNYFEHLLSMAAPISFGARKFGIIIVHQYTNKRPFQQSDLQMLESFAAQAAIALRNTEAYEQLQVVNAQYERSQYIHQIFLRLALQNAETFAILQTASKLLAMPLDYMNVLDPATYTEAAMQVLRHVTTPGLYTLDTCYYVYPVRNDNETLGYLLLQDAPLPEQLAIIENVSLALLFKALYIQAKYQMTYQDRYELFQYILTEKAPLIDKRFDALQLQTHQRTFCVTFELSAFTNRHVIHFIEQIRHHYASYPFIFTHKHYIIWVLQAEEPMRKQLVQQLPALLQSWLQFYEERVVIGIGTVKESLRQLEDSYEESLQALRQQRFHKGVSLTCYEDIGVNRLFEQHSTAQLQQFTEQVLAPLLPKKQIVLLETLCAYCAHNRVVSATAAALHIHQNTLYHRLQKIEELLQRDFTQADHVLEVSLAVHLYESYTGRGDTQA